MLFFHNATGPDNKALPIFDHRVDLDGDAIPSSMLPLELWTTSVIVATETTTTITTKAAESSENIGQPGFDGITPDFPPAQSDPADVSLSPLIASDSGTDSTAPSSSITTWAPTGGINPQSPETGPGLAPGSISPAPTASAATLTSPVVPITSFPAGITPVYPPTYSLTKSTSSGLGDASAPNKKETARNSTTPVIAGVVPAVLVVLGVAFCLWWRRHRRGKKTVHNDEQTDLEDEVNSGDKPDSLVEKAINESSGQTIRLGQNPRGGVDAVTPLVHDKPHPKAKLRPSNIALPQGNSHVTGLSSEQHTNRFNPSSAQLDDPFLTPTSQVAFASPTLNSSTIFGNSNFRPSQIGLAVTTPPGLNKSTPSPADGDDDSTRTVIRHAKHRSSDRAQEPSTAARPSTERAKHSNTVNQHSQSNHIPSTAEDIPATTSNLQTSDHNSESSTTNQASIPKSNTPPEELARRWIQVLQMEAAQAREAAADAAKRAQELRRKEITKINTDHDVAE